MITQKLAFVVYQRNTKIKIIYAEVSAKNYRQMLHDVSDIRSAIKETTCFPDGRILNDVTVIVENLKN